MFALVSHDPPPATYTQQVNPRVRSTAPLLPPIPDSSIPMFALVPRDTPLIPLMGITRSKIWTTRPFRIETNSSHEKLGAWKSQISTFLPDLTSNFVMIA